MSDDIAEKREAVHRAIAVHSLAEAEVAGPAEPEVAVETARLLNEAIDAYALAVLDAAEREAGEYATDDAAVDCVDGECGFCQAFAAIRARIPSGERR